MANTYTYDAALVTLVVNGRFITGFAEGSMVEAEKDEDNFETKVSAQGDVGIAKRNNTLGTITVILMQGSPDVLYLNALANSGQMVPVWAQSNGENAEKVGGTQAMVKKPADVEFSDEISEREFEFQVFDYTVQGN
ncbi:DUF3277 domain-containing protein [Exiguobacterium sp. s5]|uniref:phage structural protein n=1 Tax=Exiguobacterium sp. s5 TaxID=2751239 RepID=UPI001BE76197|nr:DUF3277 domain-containing protein [Exiguobacterium sp. s5]